MFLSLFGRHNMFLSLMTLSCLEIKYENPNRMKKILHKEQHVSEFPENRIIPRSSTFYNNDFIYIYIYISLFYLQL